MALFSLLQSVSFVICRNKTCSLSYCQTTNTHTLMTWTEVTEHVLSEWITKLSLENNGKCIVTQITLYIHGEQKSISEHNTHQTLRWIQITSGSIPVIQEQGSEAQNWTAEDLSPTKWLNKSHWTQTASVWIFDIITASGMTIIKTQLQHTPICKEFFLHKGMPQYLSRQIYTAAN